MKSWELALPLVGLKIRRIFLERELALTVPDIDPLPWPDDSLTYVPYGVYNDPGQYALENERLFKGPSWNYLCLSAEIQEPGDFIVTGIAGMTIIVVRNHDGQINAMVNRCAHRGAMLCLKRRGNARKFSCVYHAWSYDLDGKLTNVAFAKGIRGEGGMDDGFDMADHGLRRLRVAVYCGLVFGSFSPDTPEIKAYLGPEICARLSRVLHKPVRVLGRNTQVLPSNWKLYVENVKDSYHASILHLFFTTFRMNRLTQKGGIIVDESGGNHVSYSMIDPDIDNSTYAQADMRSDNASVCLEAPEMLNNVDEFGDGITLQILSVFPGFVLQQIRNAIAVRQVLALDADRTELNWTYLGFEDDDEAMTEHRLRQCNLVGPAGYISMEDGAVGDFVQRGIRGVSEDVSVVKMGGGDVTSSASRVTESSIRGFWKKYRALMEQPQP